MRNNQRVSPFMKTIAKVNIMPTGRPTPPPRGAGKAAAIVAVLIGLIIVTIFVGLNMQHADTMRDRQNGQVKPEDAPKTQKDLGVSPVQTR
jgi:hypothetical protein